MTPEIIRAITPLCLGFIGGIIALAATLNSAKIPAERFGLIASVAAGAIGSAGGATQGGGSRSGSVNASQVDEINIRKNNDEVS